MTPGPPPLVLRSRAKRGVSKDAPGGDGGVTWTILRDAMLRIAPQDEGSAAISDLGIARDDGIDLMFTLEEMRRAHEVVLGALKPTPAISWPLLAERLGAEVTVKHENHLPTGAFKVRGGLVYVDALTKREPATRGLISATRGNHGQSLAFAGTARWSQRDDLRAARQFEREERRNARARRRTHRIRPRLPGRARGGDAARRRCAACMRFRPSIAISRSASRPMRSSS